MLRMTTEDIQEYSGGICKFDLLQHRCILNSVFCVAFVFYANVFSVVKVNYCIFFFCNKFLGFSCFSDEVCS